MCSFTPLSLPPSLPPLPPYLLVHVHILLLHLRRGFPVKVDQCLFQWIEDFHPHPCPQLINPLPVDNVIPHAQSRGTAANPPRPHGGGFQREDNDGKPRSAWCWWRRRRRRRRRRAAAAAAAGGVVVAAAGCSVGGAATPGDAAAHCRCW